MCCLSSLPHFHTHSLTHSLTHTLLLTHTHSQVVGEVLKDASAGHPLLVFVSNLAKAAYISAKVAALSTDVTCVHFQKTLLAARVEKRVMRLQSLLHQGKSQKENLRTFWSQVCLQEVIDTNRALHELQAFEKFQEHVTANASSSLHPLLQRLAELYAMDCINRDLGWFLSHLPVCPHAARLVSERFNILCRSFSDSDALDIVAGFGIPEPMLKNIPIASQLWRTMCE
jgi:hypothetical protein